MAPRKHGDGPAHWPNDDSWPSAPDQGGHDFEPADSGGLNGDVIPPEYDEIDPPPPPERDED